MSGQTLSREEVLKSLDCLKGWSLAADGRSISKEFLMKDFMAAVSLISTIAPLAEKADHHPDLHLTGYRRLKIELSTHSEGGLTGKDFALASAIEALPKDLKA